MAIEQLEQPNSDLPRKPKSGFAREKVKRLAAEARAHQAETRLRQLGVMDDEIETQAPQQSAPSNHDKPRSGYARLRNRHNDLIKLYEILMKDHEASAAAFAWLNGSGLQA